MKNLDRILELLDEIDSLAADSRCCYENARGNDSSCYAATEEIRKLIAYPGEVGDKLRSCPFCGGRADEMSTAQSKGYPTIYGVACDCCCAQSGPYGSREDAITAWSRRTPEHESIVETAKRLGIEPKESKDAQANIDRLTGKRTAPEPEDDPSDDPGACPGCGSLNACQGECMDAPE